MISGASSPSSSKKRGMSVRRICRPRPLAGEERERWGDGGERARAGDTGKGGGTNVRRALNGAGAAAEDWRLVVARSAMINSGDKQGNGADGDEPPGTGGGATVIGIGLSDETGAGAAVSLGAGATFFAGIAAFFTGTPSSLPQIAYQI